MNTVLSQQIQKEKKKKRNSLRLSSFSIHRNCCISTRVDSERSRTVVAAKRPHCLTSSLRILSSYFFLKLAWRLYSCRSCPPPLFLTAKDVWSPRRRYCTTFDFTSTDLSFWKLYRDEFKFEFEFSDYYYGFGNTIHPRFTNFRSYATTCWIYRSTTD